MRLDQNSIAGILLVDKPTDWTSFDVVNKIRGFTKVSKVGHAGTLDPFATGLLIILLGKAWTRRQEEFLKMPKRYVVEATFGWKSDTYDLTGELTQIADWSTVSAITKLQIEQVISSHFLGEITQTVPAYSAVKVGGQRLYAMARKGNVDTVSLPSRQMQIDQFQVIEMVVDELAQKCIVMFEISCSSGTYIRSLVHDLGDMLGVGAYASSLRRTAIGQYLVAEAITLETLLKNGVEDYILTSLTTS